MIFKSKTETLSERVDRYERECKPFHDYYQNWHKWFAWYPVPIDTERKVWLQTVERRYTWGSRVNEIVYDPVYRLLNDE